MPSKVKLEVLVDVPTSAVPVVKEMCKLMYRIKLMHDKGLTIRPEYQKRFETLKRQFVRMLWLPKNQTLDNFSLDSEAFLDEEDHSKLRAEVEGMT